MVFLNRVGILINVLTLFLIGTGCILTGTSYINIDILGDYLKEANIRISVSYVGILFWFVGMIILYANYKVNKQEKGVVTKTPHGEVRITKKAIEEFVDRVCEEESFVKRIKAKIIVKPKWVRVKMVVSLWSEIAATDASAALQARVKESLSTAIGIPEIKDIKVLIEEVYHQGGKLRGIEYSSDRDAAFLKTEGQQGRLW